MQQQTKNHKKLKKLKNQRTKNKPKQKTMMSRSRASLQYICVYKISGNRILSGEEHGSSGAAGCAEFLKSGGVVGWNVSYLAM